MPTTDADRMPYWAPVVKSHRDDPNESDAEGCHYQHRLEQHAKAIQGLVAALAIALGQLDQLRRAHVPAVLSDRQPSFAVQRASPAQPLASLHSAARQLLLHCQEL